MKTNMAKTSLVAYDDLCADGKELTQRARLLAEVLDHPLGLTRRQLANVSRMELSAVCGRVNQLIKDGVVDASEETVCAFSGKTVKIIKPITSAQQDLFGGF